MVLGQELKFKNKIWNLKLGTLFSALPGHRPGCLWTQNCRPVRAKALYIARYLKAFALTGRLADCHYTQGDALG